MALDETVGDIITPTLATKIEQMELWYDRINDIFATQPDRRQGIYRQTISMTKLIDERQDVLQWLRKNEKHLQDSKQ